MTIRLMRGQCVVRETQWHLGLIVEPPRRERDVKIHRGIVVGLGAPSKLGEFQDAPEVPWGFNVGDEIVYVFVHHKDAHTRPWEDGKDAVWIPQACILGVWQCSDLN